MDHVRFTAEQLPERLEYWKGILRLKDWDIQVYLRRIGPGMGDDEQGNVSWTLCRKEAVIRLLDPMDWDEKITWPQDHEVTLVHELIHLHMAPFDTFKDGTPENTALEQCIVLTSKALVALDRAHRVKS